MGSIKDISVVKTNGKVIKGEKAYEVLMKASGLNEEMFKATGDNKFMRDMRGYMGDIYKFLPFLSHSKLGRDKWYFLKENWNRALQSPSSVSRQMRNNARSDKSIIVSEASVGSGYYEDARSYMSKMRGYWGDADKFLAQAQAAKKRAQTSPKIPNISKKKAIINADEAIKKYGFLKEGWNEANRLYNIMKVDLAFKNSSTPTTNIGILDSYISSTKLSTDGDARFIADKLKEIEKNMRSDKSRLIGEAKDAENYSKKELGGRFWDKIKKLNPLSAAARNAFLGLTKINALGFASKMDNLRKRANVAEPTAKAEENWKQLEYTWLQVGGNLDSLSKAIDAGKSKRPLLVKKDKFSATGIETPSTELVFSVTGVEEAAALITAATPIIILIIPLLKDSGEDVSGMDVSGVGLEGDFADESPTILGIPETGFYILTGGIALTLVGTVIYYYAYK